MITRERARELRAVIEGAVSAYDMEDSEPTTKEVLDALLGVTP